jgi:type I restriction enzyme R subunit
MDKLSALLTQGQHKNQYFYAFTATPKPKTLQTFGEKKGDKYDAFHHYSMR